MSWYRRYRPQTIAGLHLASVRDTFQKMMSQGKLPQVMLFAGPKGTGKTSTARIVAAMVNDPGNEAIVSSVFLGKATPKKTQFQEPDTKQELLQGIFEGNSWLVQELDAASNRGIDDIRAIKERVNLPPQAGLMTVYIFDEVHMLTTEAFNALLKLLEEPPAHVLFILATTELHKIPATITSRATMVPFQQATTKELGEALTQVLEAEKVKFEPKAVELIATAADGSFRDAVKLAEMLSNTLEKLDEASVSEALKTSLDSTVAEIIVAVVNKQPQEVVTHFQKLRESQASPDQVMKLFFTTLHHTVLQHLQAATGEPLVSQAAALFLLQELQHLPPNTAPIPLLHLEVKLLDLIQKSQQKSAKSEDTQAPIRRQVKKNDLELTAAPPVEIIATSTLATVELPAAPLTPTDVIDSSPRVVVSDNLRSVSSGDSAKLLSQWETFVDLVRMKNSSLAALLKSAQPLTAEPGTATIAVYYKFHQEQLQQPKFVKMIEECIEPLIGGRVKLEFILKEPTAASTTPSEQNSQKSDTLSSLAEELLV